METYFHPCIQVDFQLLFRGKIISINPASISTQECFHQSHFHLGKQFFHQSSFHLKVTISNNFVDEMSLDEVSVDEDCRRRNVVRRVVTPSEIVCFIPNKFGKVPENNIKGIVNTFDNEAEIA